MSKREQGMHKDILDRMIEIRRHLHRHPELSNEEAKTQAYLKQALETEGLLGIREVAGYGLAVDIVGEAQASNRKVAIRADIDALPIAEDSGVDFASANPGVMLTPNCYRRLIFHPIFHRNFCAPIFQAYRKFLS